MTRRLVGTAASVLFAVASVAAPPTLVGKPAPDFVLKSVTGGNLRLSEYRGQVVLVNFWARWAGDSREEMVALEHIDATYRRAGLVILGVSVDEDEPRARAYAAGMKIGYPILFDTTPQIGRDYHIETMPMTMLIDRSGVVRFVNTGYKRGDEHDYLEQIRELLRE